MKNSTPFFLSISLVFIFSSCKKENIGPAPGYSYVMAFNAAASTSNSTIDVTVGQQKMSAIAFGSNSMYQQIASGNSKVNINFSGDSTASSMVFEKDKNYSIFAIDDSIAMRAVIVNDILPGNTIGISNIRFLQFSADAPAMNIVIGSDTLFTNRKFNDQATADSFAAFKTILPGVYDIEVRDPATAALLYTFNSILIEEGKTYNMFTKGSIYGTNERAFGLALVPTN